jgi:putative transcriptional regulator
MAFPWFHPATWLHPALSTAASLAAMLFSAALPPAMPATPAPQAAPPAAPPYASLVGDLLVASPHIGDPRFWHTVILIVEQDKGGTLGIVINRPMAVVPLAGLLNAVGLNGAGVTAKIRVFSGGPVDPTAGFVLHSAEYHGAGTVPVDGHVAMTENLHILLDIAHGHGPAKSLLAFGYAGWGPGQLAMELARGDWAVTPETEKLLFDDKRDHVWDDATASRTTPL